MRPQRPLFGNLAINQRTDRSPRLGQRTLRTIAPAIVRSPDSEIPNIPWILDDQSPRNGAFYSAGRALDVPK
jgi:hypothetical protein